MLNDLELMTLQACTLFTANAESRLLLVNEPGNTTTPAPRFFLGRTRAGNVMRSRADLSDELFRELEALYEDEPPLATAPDEPPRHVERYRQLLDAVTPVRQMSAGPAYHVSEIGTPSRPLVVVTERNAEALKGGFEKLRNELPLWQPFVALVKDGRAVSVCRSVRITAGSHEAGVETLPDFRGNGYARDVVTGWALRVRAGGAPAVQHVLGQPGFAGGRPKSEDEVLRRGLSHRLDNDIQVETTACIRHRPPITLGARSTKSPFLSESEDLQTPSRGGRGSLNSG